MLKPSRTSLLKLISFCAAMTLMTWGLASYPDFAITNVSTAAREGWYALPIYLLLGVFLTRRGWPKWPK